LAGIALELILNCILLTAGEITPSYKGNMLSSNSNYFDLDRRRILFYECDEFSQRSPDMKNLSIMIDPGHGGRDSGAVFTPHEGPSIREKDLTLPLAYQVGAHLHRLFKGGLDIDLTRTEDVKMTVVERVDMSLELEPDLFVSLHINSCEGVDVARGIEVLYYSETSKGYAVAQNIRNWFVNTEFPRHGQGLVKRPRLGVLKKTKMPAILVEALFRNSTTYRSFLLNMTKFNKLAARVAEGIYRSRSLLSGG